MVSKTEPFGISVSEYQRLTPYGRHSSCRLWRRLLVTSGVKRWPTKARNGRAGRSRRSIPRTASADSPETERNRTAENSWPARRGRLPSRTVRARARRAGRSSNRRDLLHADAKEVSCSSAFCEDTLLNLFRMESRLRKELGREPKL